MAIVKNIELSHHELTAIRDHRLGIAPARDLSELGQRTLDGLQSGADQTGSGIVLGHFMAPDMFDENVDALHTLDVRRGPDLLYRPNPPAGFVPALRGLLIRDCIDPTGAFVQQFIPRS